MNKTSVLLAAAALAGPAFAQGTDDCTAPTQLTAVGSFAFDTSVATTLGFAGAAGACDPNINQDLFWVFTSPIAGAIQFDTDGSSFDTKISVFDGANCSATCIDTDDDGGLGLQSLLVIPGVSVGDVFLVQVGGFGTAAGTGVLNIDMTVPAPDCLMPDFLESNVDCATATPINDGTFSGLNVQETDNDYYAVTVPAGGQLNVDILFSNTFSDVDLYLWDPAVECDTNVAGTGGAFLANGFSASDDESITYDNVSGADQNLIIEVDMFSAGGCNDYEMIVLGAGMGDGGIGTGYCATNPNSTTGPGTMVVTGSRAVADNDVTLVATNLPPFSFGFFNVSLSQGFVPNPNGSQGNLCLGGAIGRYVGMGQIMGSGATGEIMLPVDLTMTPSPTGLVSVSAGDTYNFQLWHRDTLNGVSTSNFTNGYTVDFN